MKTKNEMSLQYQKDKLKENYIKETDLETIYLFWKEKTKEIKTQKFDKYQILEIKRDFILDLGHHIAVFQMYQYGEKMRVLENELNFCLQVSFSNFRSENKFFWSNLFSNTIKTIPRLFEK